LRIAITNGYLEEVVTSGFGKINLDDGNALVANGALYLGADFLACKVEVLDFVRFFEVFEKDVEIVIVFAYKNFEDTQLVLWTIALLFIRVVIATQYYGKKARKE